MERHYGECRICTRIGEIDDEHPHGRCQDCQEVAGKAFKIPEPTLLESFLRVLLMLLIVATPFLMVAASSCAAGEYSVRDLRAALTLMIFVAGAWLAAGVTMILHLIRN